MTTNFPCGRDCIKPFASITLLNLHNSLNEEGVCVSLIDGNVSLDKRVTCPRGIPGWRKHTCQILHKKKKKGIILEILANQITQDAKGKKFYKKTGKKMKKKCVWDQYICNLA